MKRVIVESPFAGRGEGESRVADASRNLDYLRACLADALARGEAPFASHGLYTQPGVLRDEVPEERVKGIAAGFAWRSVANLTVFYEDRGWSGGMCAALAHCNDTGSPYEVRRIGGKWGEP